MTSEELLEVLDRLFPDKCPTPDLSDREIWIRVGQRQVVERMRSWFDSVDRSALTVLDPINVSLP